MQMERVAIFGLGNVALDCARVLLRGEDAMGRTDIARHAQEALNQSAVKRVDIIGRRGPVQARTFMCSLRFNTPLPLLAPLNTSSSAACRFPVYLRQASCVALPVIPGCAALWWEGSVLKHLISIAGGVHH